MADAWTSSGHVLGKIIATDAHAHLPRDEWKRIEEVLDFQKMNQLRSRVDAIVCDPATAERANGEGSVLHLRRRSRE